MNLTECKVQHLGWSNNRYEYRLGYKRTESSPVKQILGVLVENLDMKWQCALSAQKTNQKHWAAPKEVWSPCQLRWFFLSTPLS